MELQGERLIPAGVPRTWAALNDPDTLKACIPGCESVTRTGDNTFESVVALKVGPVSARFKGRLEMTNVNAPNSYTINFDGQGGAAGFGKGSADVSLVPEGDDTKLSFSAKAQVGGKMAQIGSRLVDATAQKLTEQFFSAFEAHLRPVAATLPDAVPVDESGAAVTAPAKASSQAVWWIVGIAVAAALAYWLSR